MLKKYSKKVNQQALFNMVISFIMASSVRSILRIFVIDDIQMIIVMVSVFCVSINILTKFTGVGLLNKYGDAYKVNLTWKKFWINILKIFLYSILSGLLVTVLRGFC